MAPSTYTNLPHNLPSSHFLDGMDLGVGIDAITGEISDSAIHPDFTTTSVVSANSADSLVFRSVENVAELESSVLSQASSSVTFPAGGSGAHAKSAFDFSSSNKSSTSVMFILLDWEHSAHIQRIAGAKLSEDAQKKLESDPVGFRESYGDYFVYDILYKTKFTAVWKCSSSSSKSLKSFNDEMSAGGAFAGQQVSADGSFSNKLSSAASRHNITVNVQYNTVGDSGATAYDLSDMVKTFLSFRENAKPVPAEVTLHHYTTINPTVPPTINMCASVFERISKVAASSRFVVLLAGLLPGTPSVTLERRNKIAGIFESIYANRLDFVNNPDALDGAIKQLEDLKHELSQRLERQNLLTEIDKIPYDTFKSQFPVLYEDKVGAWIHSSKNNPVFSLGRTGFDADELQTYAITKAVDVSHIDDVAAMMGVQTGSLTFPGASGINGYVVGIEVISVDGGDGNGLWCIRHDFVLGGKSVRVDVRSDFWRGMKWKLTVHYIPASEYDE